MKLLSTLVIVILFSIGCKKQDVGGGGNNNNPPVVIQKGTITGKVVAANNITPIKNATVFIADGATIFNTVTDVNGNFSLQAPEGQRELHIQSGTGKIFRTKLNVTIEANKTIAISASAVKLNQVASLAYIPGTYDKIEAILIDSLGYSATMITSNQLHSLNSVSNFNAIFINCSSNIPVDGLQDSVLASYVANGGSIYASDYAVATLIGSYVGGGCPGMRPWGFIPDSKLCTQRTGSSGLVPNSPIVLPALQAYLNKTWMDVKYNLGSWEMIMSYDANFWESLVMHPSMQGALLLRTANFTNGSAGTVNIGSTANNDMVTICHKPAGTTPVTITISSSALSAHLAHGDSIGSCQSTNGAGRIYFTTFHTQPNGLISPDMKNILDYIILNL